MPNARENSKLAWYYPSIHLPVLHDPILALSAPVYGQAPRCQAELRYLKLPARAFTDDVFGLNEPPLTLSFSKDGIDVYSATDFKTMHALQQYGTPDGTPIENALTVILVYQREDVRREKMESLRKTVRVADILSGGGFAPLTNLKFAAWRFELTPIWVDNVLERKWLVAGIAHFEPTSCERTNSRTPASSPDYLEASVSNSNMILNEMLPRIPRNRRLPAVPSSVLGKALDVMRHLSQKYGLPN